MTNFAVIESGYWGKNLVRNFNELGALHTICDNNPETLRCFQEKYPEKNFQTSIQSVEDKLKQGEALFTEGKIEEAEKCFMDLVKKNSEDVEALNNLGVISYHPFQYFKKQQTVFGFHNSE